MRKKMMAWMLVIAVMFSLMPFPITTAYAEVEGDWTYTLYDGDTKAAITGYTGTAAEIAIPETISGKPVTRIGQNAFNGSAITTVTIPDSVVQIDNNAFANNRNLTSVTIEGNNLLSLGDGAFSITSLSTIRIPTSLTAIPGWAFNDTALNELTIPANITSIGYYAFGNNPNLDSVLFEGNAPTMGDYVFTIPSSGFTAYYYSGSTGFTTPTWTAGYAILNTVELARPITYVCEVEGVQYETLDEGIAAAAVDDDTIKLLTDIDYTGELRLIADTWINLNGFSLDVVNDSGIALYADGHDLDISGTGSLNVTGSTFGAFIRSGASVEVTNATATAEAGKAVYALDPNCSVTVFGDVTANAQQGTAVYVEGSGSSSATIHGDVYAQGTGGIGVCAASESSIKVMGRIYATNYLQVGALIKEEGEYTSLENNYYIYTDGSATVRAKQEVCALNGTPYLFLEDALVDAESGDTITLLADIRYVDDIVLTDIDLHFDLDTYKLDVGRTGAEGSLKVDGSTLTIDDTEGGELNIVTGYYGVYALNGGTATVTSIADPTPSNSLNGYGIIGESGGSVTVKEDISVLSYQGYGMNLMGGATAHVFGDIYSLNGIVVQQSGSSAVVEGNISATTGQCASVGSDGSVVVYGDVHGNYRTVQGYGGTIHVMGDVLADRWEGVYAYGGADIVIDGSVTSPYGPYAWGEGTTVLIKKNTTTTDPAYWGAYAFGGAEITVGGAITAADAANYVKVGDTVMAEDAGVLTGRYTVYSDGESAVRTKGIEFFKEDFEGAGFDGWDQSDSGWSITETMINPTATVHGGDQVAMFNSHEIPYAGQSRLYQTESLNLSVGTDYWLEFWMHHDAMVESSIDSVFVQISTDQGLHWVDLGRYYRYSETEGWKKEAISLASYAGQSDVRLAFHGMSGNNNNIFIDDISVSHECVIDGCSVTEAYGGFIGSQEIEGETFYEVATAEQLAHVSDHRNRNFILTEDIDLSGGQWTPIGKTYGTSFNGRFDGNGHSISGMTITEVSGADAYGLFGNLGIDGIIENLTVESGDIAFFESAGNGYFGGIAGHSLGLVENCVNKADITITNDDWTYAGGIVGAGNADIGSYTWSARILGCRNEGDIEIGRIGSVGGIIGNQWNSTAATYIDRCSNDGSITGGQSAEAGGIAGRIHNANTIGIISCYNTGNVTSGDGTSSSVYAGGIVGYEYYSQVKNCYNTGSITALYGSEGNVECGGIAGHADIPAENCYNTGTITGTGRAGEGINGAGIACTNCYYLDTSTPSTEIDGITSATAAQMKNQATFTDWVFPGVWTINSTDNNGYPALAWQGFSSASSDATLSGLSASGVALTPAFDSGTTEYDASVSNGTSGTTISATVSDGAATLLIDGEEVSEKEVVLNVGSNVIVVEITAEDGIHTETYTITINRSSGGSSRSRDTIESYEITPSADTGGSIDPSGSLDVKENESITFTITPDLGYVIADVLVNGVSVGAVSEYTIAEVGEDYTVTAVFEPASKRFVDVDGSQWYREGIDFALGAGLFTGTSETTFEPDADMTRAMLVTVLWRLDHEPDAALGTLFGDIDQAAWYAEAVAWAAENGIVKGYDADTFSPDDSITREQMAAILHRYASHKGYDLTASADLSSFSDAEDISEWALEAKRWAVAKGLINGVGEASLEPAGTATRAQVATILMRFVGSSAE